MFALGLRPDGNEVIPLIEMLTDGRFKRTHDFLGELPAGATVAKRGAIVGNHRQNVSGITPVGARQIDREQHTTRSARQFGGSNGS